MPIGKRIHPQIVTIGDSTPRSGFLPVNIGIFLCKNEPAATPVRITSRKKVALGAAGFSQLGQL
ncbi:MAG: hypothetical protein ABSG52_03835 [Terriglobales bacterium]